MAGPRYGGGCGAGFQKQFRRVDCLPGAECLPCLRVASGSRQHGSSSSHQRSSSRFRVDSRFRRQGRQLHPGKNAVRNAGTQGAGSGVKRRQSPGDRSGIPERGRRGPLIRKL